MKLRTIEISGFKSFADHTKIDFKNGITGIVGPNGSGKSNIIEAIRWVMGETSAKSLRGGKMPDVIFSGTEKRKPLARAAVTIVFDNSDHFLDTKYDEVMISRRLFRDGESQYEINRQECRLKDILNLFIDTGLGRESFSVISQGRVEAIFSSKPEDRRAIIEEAAGVLEYKQDKRRAESELEKTSGYLERVNDLVVELEKQVEPLAKQAAVAKDYVEQKQRFDELEQTRLALNIKNNQVEQQRLIKAVHETKDQLEMIEEQSDNLNQKRQAIKQKVNNELRQKDTIQADLVEINRLEQQIKGQKDLQLERQKYLNQEKTRITSEKVQVEERLSQNSTSLKDNEEQLVQLRSQIKSIKTSLTALDSSQRELQKERLQNEIENLRAQYVDLLQELTSLKNQYNFNQQDLQRDEQQRQKIQVTIDSLTEQIKNHQSELDVLQSRLKDLETNQKHLNTKLQELTNQKNSVKSQFENARQQWLDGSNVLHQAASKLEALHNFKNEYNGFYQGVRAALKQKEHFTGIIGPVADIMNVPAKYTVAIETALGNQVQNVVVDTDETAKKVIEYLKEQRLGRVTFLPKNALKPRFVNEELLQKVASLTGFIGVASELVRTNAGNEIISQYLLGSTLIVDDLKHAITISRSINRRSRIITLDGDVIGVGGTMTGGATKNNRQGVLHQDQEIKNLEIQVEKMQTKLDQKESEVQELAKKEKAVNVEYEEIKEQQVGINQQIDRINSQISLEEERIGEFERRQKASQFELSQVTEDSDLVANLPQQIDDLQKQVESIKQNTAEKQAELALFDSNEEERKNQFTNLQMDLAKYQEQLNQLKQQTIELSNLETDYKAQISQLDQQLDDLLTESENDFVEESYSLEEVQNRLNAQNQALESIQAQLANDQVSQDQITADFEISQQKLNQIQNQVKDVEGSLNLVQNKLEADIDQLAEEYNQTIESVQSRIIDGIDSEQLRRELKLLKRGLSELGTVNLGAIEEYDRVSTRYNFLREQKDDLTNSKAQLEQSIAEIDLEASQRFKQTFVQVASEFSRVFVKMFGGGEAQLELTNPNDLLNTGIEIKAQPPGKKLQRLSLLSGGEKSLTAITLLFAILQVKPVPFCILDEVEAAFDDANVDRFAKYLKTFQDTTQFIVITHRKGTMMEADVLYGVTMQESGVSKMVSVSMDEIEQREQVQ